MLIVRHHDSTDPEVVLFDNERVAEHCEPRRMTSLFQDRIRWFSSCQHQRSARRSSEIAKQQIMNPGPDQDREERISLERRSRNKSRGAAKQLCWQGIAYHFKQLDDIRISKGTIHPNSVRCSPRSSHRNLVRPLMFSRPSFRGPNCAGDKVDSQAGRRTV